MTIKWATWFLMILALLVGPAQAQEMMVITEEAPPFNFTRDGALTGSSTEIVREILRRLHLPDNIQVLPWARGYKLLQSEPYVALFSTIQTPEREDQFHWVGPLFTVHFSFYARKDRGLQIQSLQDARAVGSIATYKDDVREQLLISMGFKNLDSSKSPTSNLKKLMAGRVDLWLFSNIGVFGLARQQGVDPSELELVLPFRSYQSYVAISKSTPRAVVKRWQSILDAMVQDGTFFNISRRWLPLDSMPDFSEAHANPTGSLALKIYTEDSPPGSYVEDGQPVGFAVDVVREILRRLKHPDTITVVPWSRGYTLAQNAPGVALFSTTRLAAREQLFHWVGPLYSQTWAFYSRKGAGIRIDSLAQAREIKRIGTYLKDAKAQYLEDRGFDNLVSANRNISNIRHLVDGKLDLWVSSDFNMPYLVRQAGFDPDDFEQVYSFQSVTNYIAFSLGTPPTIIHEWQQCLEDIKTDGTYTQIARKYNLQLTD